MLRLASGNNSYVSQATEQQCKAQTEYCYNAAKIKTRAAILGLAQQ